MCDFMLSVKPYILILITECVQIDLSIIHSPELVSTPCCTLFLLTWFVDAGECVSVYLTVLLLPDAELSDALPFTRGSGVYCYLF